MMVFFIKKKKEREMIMCIVEHVYQYHAAASLARIDVINTLCTGHELSRFKQAERCG